MLPEKYKDIDNLGKFQDDINDNSTAKSITCNTITIDLCPLGTICQWQFVKTYYLGIPR
jgi:hypothetical protein